MSKTYEEELREAISGELCNGNWMYFGKGDAVGHVLRAVKSVLAIRMPAARRKTTAATKRRKRKG